MSAYTNLAQSLGPVLIANQSRDGTHWRDDSGNGLHGALSGAPAWNASGGPGAGVPGYFTFNGVDQHTNHGNASIFEFVRAHTLVYWERTGFQQPLDYGTFISKGDRSYHVRAGTRNTLSDERRINIRNDALSLGDAAVINPITDTSSWVMYMARHTGTRVAIWRINASGVAVELAGLNMSFDMGHTTSNFCLGAQDNTGTMRRWWKGDLAGVLVFDKSLDTADFEALYTAASDAGNPYTNAATGLGAVLVVNQSRDATTWYDNSGNGLHGTLANTPTWSATGGPTDHIPGYFALNGTNQHANFGDPAALRWASNAVTFAWWQRVNGSAQTGYAQILGKGNDNSAMLRHENTAGRNLRWEIRNGGGIFAAAATTTNPVGIDTWEMFVGTWNGTWARLYRVANGTATLLAEDTDPGTLGTDTSRFYIGAQNRFAESLADRRWWRGDIAGVALFDAVLTTTQMESLYDAASNTGEAALTGAGTLYADGTASGAAQTPYPLLLEDPGSVLLEDGEYVGLEETFAQVEGAANLAGAGNLYGLGALVVYGAANLAGTGTLSGDGAAKSVGQAAMSGAGTLAGTGTAKAVAQAAVTGAGSVSGTGLVRALAQAVMDGAGLIAATAFAVALALAACSGAGTLYGSGQTTQMGQAALAGEGNLSGAAQATANGQASLSGEGALGAAGAATAAAIGHLAGAGDLVGTASTRSLGAAALAGEGNLVGTGTTETPEVEVSWVYVRAPLGAETGAAALRGVGDLAGAGLVAAFGEAALSGAGALGAAGSANAVGTAALAGAGDLTAEGVSPAVGQAGLTGAGNLTAEASIPGAFGQAALLGAGDLAGDGSAELLAAAHLEGSGLLGATGRAVALGAAALTGVGDLAGNGTPTSVAVGDLAGAGLVAAEGQATALAQAALTGSGHLAGAGDSTYYGAADLLGAGLFGSAGSATAVGAAHLSGEGKLVARQLGGPTPCPLDAEDGFTLLDEDGQGVGSEFVGCNVGGGALVGAGNLSGNGAGVALGNANLTGQGALYGSGGEVFAHVEVSWLYLEAPQVAEKYIGAAALMGEGLLSGAGSGEGLGQAHLTGEGSLDSEGRATAYGQVGLSGEGTLYGAGSADGAATVFFRGEGNLAAEGYIPPIGEVAFAGEGNLAADGGTRSVGAVALLGQGTLVANGLVVYGEEPSPTKPPWWRGVHVPDASGGQRGWDQEPATTPGAAGWDQAPSVDPGVVGWDQAPVADAGSGTPHFETAPVDVPTTGTPSWEKEL